MSKFENKLLKTVLKEYMEEDAPSITNEQKRAFMEAVANFHSFGESIYRNNSLREITGKLKEVIDTAEHLTLSESEHWFDNVTVGRHVKQLKEAYKVFEKTAKEVTGLQQRLESAYEDIGGVLNKYYKVNEALADKDLEEKLVFYKDKDKKLRRFDTDKSANKKYQ